MRNLTDDFSQNEKEAPLAVIVGGSINGLCYSAALEVGTSISVHLEAANVPGQENDREKSGRLTNPLAKSISIDVYGDFMDLEIALCGDIMLGAEVDRNIGSATVSDWLRGLSSVKCADLVIGNLECPCVFSAQPVNGPIPEIIFRAPARRAVELADAGFTALTLANNHILNCGPSGLSETVQALRKADLRYAGAGMSLEEALQPAFIPVHGVTIGLVAFSYSPVATRTKAGVAQQTEDNASSARDGS